ncbi:hypothetical protein EJB05_02502, partial [Eragrostis curvula]
MEALGLRKLAKKAAAAVVAANGGTPPPPQNYEGVRLRPWGEWCAEIRDSPTTIVWLGDYDNAVEAACAYDAAARILRPDDARTNFPEPEEVNKEERAAVVLAYFAVAKRRRAEDARLKTETAEAGGASSSKPSPAAAAPSPHAPAPPLNLHFPNAIATPPSFVFHHVAANATYNPDKPATVSVFYTYEP